MATRRRTRRRSGPPRCQKCGRTILWLRWAHPPYGWRTFEPKPVDLRHHNGDAYPVEANRAWRFPELVEDLMVRRECSEPEAQEEAYAVPWHTPHHCPESEAPQ